MSPYELYAEAADVEQRLHRLAVRESRLSLEALVQRLAADEGLDAHDLRQDTQRFAGDS